MIRFSIQVFFEKVFVTRPWKALFVITDDDIRDWWMRWKIDRYSMPCGMVLALAYHLGRKYKILEDDNHGNLFSTKFSLSTVLFSILGIVGYGVFSLMCRNQLECVEIHSYVTFIPVCTNFFKKHFFLLKKLNPKLQYIISLSADSQLYFAKKCVRYAAYKIFDVFCLVWTNMGGITCGTISYLVI